MNAGIKATLSVFAALGIAATPLRAASFDKATITRLEKDVKVLKANSAPHSAATGETINAVTSVATGVSSRAEMQFPDKSLTRLGANSRFTLRGTGHTIDLDKGVLLFQVPEKLRDAKVRTGAITAAVTGGTMIIEYLPGGFIKILVIEGLVDVYLNADASQFLTLHAGQMLILPANAKTLSEPVEFDLARLLKTSRLINDNRDDSPNTKEINEALNKQRSEINDGELVKTQLVIPGLGTTVQLDTNTRLTVLDSNQPPGSPPPPRGGRGNLNGNVVPIYSGVVPLIVGTTVLNSYATIKTDPTVDAFNSTTGALLLSNGSIYNPATDGPFPYFGFGSTQIADPDLQSRLASAGIWAAFKFENLLINGNPYIDTSGYIVLPSYGETNVPNLILSALGNISLAVDNQYSTGPESPGSSTDPDLNLGESGLTGLLLYSQNGSINIANNFYLYAPSQQISIVAPSAASNIAIDGDIYASTLLVSAGRDVNIASSVLAEAITLRAGRDVMIDGGSVVSGPSTRTVEASNGDLLVSAKRNIHITNSAELKALSDLSADILLRLESLEGNITIDTFSKLSGTNIEIEASKGNVTILGGSMLTATHALKARAMGANGTLLIQGATLNAGLTSDPSDLIRLYADGSNGTVRFRGYVTLDSDEVQIAGKTVQVDSGGIVNVTQGNTHVFADQHNYNTGTYGNINSTNLQKYTFGDPQKKGFKVNQKFGRQTGTSAAP